jgi:hypothetical protein
VKIDIEKIQKLQKEGNIVISEIKEGQKYFIVINKSVVKKKDLWWFLDVLRLGFGLEFAAFFVEAQPDEAISIYEIKK